MFDTSDYYVQCALRILDDADPHEFATAYVNHVERTGNRPVLTAAARHFVTTGRVA